MVKGFIYCKYKGSVVKVVNNCYKCRNSRIEQTALSQQSSCSTGAVYVEEVHCTNKSFSIQYTVRLCILTCTLCNSYYPGRGYYRHHIRGNGL